MNPPAAFLNRPAILWFRGLALVLVALFASISALHAQDFEGQTVSDVVIRYKGPRNVDEARLRNLMSTTAGSTYRAENLDSDIQSLYESGLVDDVRILAEPVGNRVRVIAEVTTRPALDAVGFAGNTVFTDQKLARESKLEAGGALSDAEILTARRNIEEYYRGYGYPDVVVTHRIQAGGRGGSDLIFLIDEGSKNEIRRIRFEGNNTFTNNELRKEMKTKPKGFFSWLTKSGRFEAQQLDEDVDAVLDFYRTRGFLRVSSPGPRLDPVRDGRVDLVIPINEGEKYTVIGVGFGRMSVFKPDDFYPLLTLNTGGVYSSEKMRADSTMIRSFYGSRGYADAMVTPELRDAGPNRVNITYNITEGERFRVGRVNIQGNTKTKDKVIRREIPLKPGDQFNSVELDTTRSRLQNLQYFSDVQVTGRPAGSGYRDVEVLVAERSTGSVGVGLGFSSIDNIVGFLSLEQSNFDLFNPWNFTGGGQRFGMNLRLGSERTDFSISLVEPWFMDRRLALGGELFFRESSFFSDFYDQKNVGGNVFIRKPITDKSSMRIEYTLEQVNIDSRIKATSFNGTGADSEFFDGKIGGDFIRSAVGFRYLYDSRDRNILPRKGHKIDASLTVAGGIFGGDVDTVTLSLIGQKHWNLKWDTILTVNGELAFVDAINGDVPIFERMFLGGGRTLRGFEFRDVGPRDSGFTNEVYGGQSLGFLSLEYTIPVIETVRVAMFYDMGFVNAGAWDPSPSDLHSDVGLGLRLNLPISPLPIAFDYAIPVSSPDKAADKGGQFNFYLSYEY